MAAQRGDAEETPKNRATRRDLEARRRPGLDAEREDRPHGTPSKRGDRRHLHVKLRELQSSEEDDWQDYEG